jgi:hypothetical protein
MTAADDLDVRTGLSAAERRLRGIKGGNAKWKKIPDRTAATKAMRDAANYARFENMVDPDRKLTPEVRAKLASSARREYMASLSLKASKARRARKAGGTR